MPSFDTPEPISVTGHLGAGSLRLVAADRPDTVVEVRPRDPGRDRDVRAAERTEVGCVSGILTIRAKERPLIGPSGFVDVTVELPTGSRVDVTGSWAEVIGEGRLGEVRVKNSFGDVRLDATGPLKATVPHGALTVDRVEGGAEITSATGSVRVGHIEGPAVLKNANGPTTVGTVTGELRLSGANSGIDIGRAGASVTGTATNGRLHIAEVSSGEVRLETSNGAIQVGVRAGTAAWLDLGSERGQVRNALAAAEGPEETEGSVTIRARTGWGTIDILRAKEPTA
ncbi:hypothetical protein AB0O07_04665 [Streptomyces sp. NPDC093085]|uniref:DUF4097 family beta strand repeat-containing protein n=1 Tax=Streptomyces sp. NPDC093085 TaxID=3155068 RepID=UPI00342D8D97